MFFYKKNSLSVKPWVFLERDILNGKGGRTGLFLFSSTKKGAAGDLPDQASLLASDSSEILFSTKKGGE